jgi:hypothetical protein
MVIMLLLSLAGPYRKKQESGARRIGDVSEGTV